MEELDQTTKTEPGTEEVSGQPGGEGSALPTVEELQQEVERKESVIRQLKSDIKEIRKSGGSKAEIDSLSRKIDDMQDWVAGAMDDLLIRTSGDYEEAKPTRKSYREELQSKRTQQPAVDPAAQRFFDYLTDEGLDFDDDVVQEAMRTTQTPQQALKALKDKMKGTNQEEVKKLAEQMLKEALPVALEQRMKEMGLTTGGAGSPSGSSGRSFTREQIRNMPMDEYKEKLPEINEAIRQGRVK